MSRLADTDTPLLVKRAIRYRVIVYGRHGKPWVKDQEMHEGKPTMQRTHKGVASPPSLLNTNNEGRIKRNKTHAGLLPSSCHPRWQLDVPTNTPVHSTAIILGNLFREDSPLIHVRKPGQLRKDDRDECLGPYSSGGRFWQPCFLIPLSTEEPNRIASNRSAPTHTSSASSSSPAD